MCLGHLYVFGEMCVLDLCFLIRLFVFLILSCMKCLYILPINLFSVVLFAVIFSHSEGSFGTNIALDHSKKCLSKNPYLNEAMIS